MKNRPQIGVLLGAMLLEFDYGGFLDVWQFWFLDSIAGGPLNFLETPYAGRHLQQAFAAAVVLRLYPCSDVMFTSDFLLSNKSFHLDLSPHFQR